MWGKKPTSFTVPYEQHSPLVFTDMKNNKQLNHRWFHSLLVAVLPAIAVASLATGCDSKSGTKKNKKAQIEARTAKANNCEAKLKACIDPYMECIGQSEADPKKDCETPADKCFKGIEDECFIEGLDLDEDEFEDLGCDEENSKDEKPKDPKGDKKKDEKQKEGDKKKGQPEGGEDDPWQDGDEWSEDEDQDGDEGDWEGDDEGDWEDDDEGPEGEWDWPEGEGEDGCVEEDDLVDDMNDWIGDLVEGSSKAVEACLKKYSECEGKDGESGLTKCLDALEACVKPHLKKAAAAANTKK